VLANQPMTQVDAWRMVRKRALAAGIMAPIGNHSFRATGITAYLANGGTLEHAQSIMPVRLSGNGALNRRVVQQ
jgi:site-specific recombinase XerD